MSEMVERVARALARHDLCKVLAAGNEEARGYSIEAMANAALAAEKSLINDYVDQARAAIKAIREPTEAMVMAARITDLWDVSVPDDAPEGVHLESTREELGNAWRAMIDEAVK